MTGELRCEQVAAAYGDRLVLEGLDLVVPQGTLTAILGASGSGKTTLLRAIMGFIPVLQGRVLVGDVVVADAAGSHLPPEKRAVGYVAQEGALYPHLTVAGNVGFGLPRAERKAGRRISEVLELVGLSNEYAPRQPHQLSGGEQRRVALARALAPRPPLVLLDEPFSGLDAALRTETREAVLHALGAQGTTAVLVTHDQAEALSTGREVAVLRDGRLVQTAPPADLYRTPVDLDVARFVGEAVVLPGHARAGHVSCALGDLSLRDGRLEGAVQAMLRPEQIQVRPRGADRAAGTGLALATVVGRTFFGPETVLRLALDGAGEQSVTARVLSHDVPAPGDLVELDVSGPVVAYPVGPERSDHAPAAANAVGSTR